MICDKGYIWNPSNSAWECDKLCDIGHYLDYKNCVCRKGLVDKLVEECINVIDGDTMYHETLSIGPNDNRLDLKDFGDIKYSKTETEIY